MATYRLSVYVAKRHEGRSATAMAAYRACEKVADERTGQEFDYSRKSGLLYSEIIVPENAPEWAQNRSELWNRSEDANRKGNAIVAREIQLSLPHELTNFERSEVAREFANYMADRHGIAVDLCLHAPNREGDERNYHAHLMLCTRPFDENQATGLSKNTARELDPIACSRKGNENHVTHWRDTWANMLNNALERSNVRDDDGVQVVVDPRSYKDREIDLEPQLKEGPTATAMKRRGEQSDRVEINDEIKARNAAKFDAEELRRRQSQNITERSAQELGLKEKQTTPEPITRQAQQIVLPLAERLLVAANDNTEPKNEPPTVRLNRLPSETDAQYQARCQRVQERSEQIKEGPKLQDNKPEKADPAARLKPLPWETAEQFEARQQKMRDHVKDKLTALEPHLKPKGPGFRY